MKNRIETDISRTTEMICSLRAASFFEKDGRYNSDDHIAPKLLPRILLPFVKSKIIKNL